MNSTAKIYAYYNKIKNVSKCQDMQSFEEFEKTMTRKAQEVIYLEYGLIRIDHIIRGHKGELHAYIFSKDVFKNIRNIKFIIHQVMMAHRMVRLECTVDKECKGLQRVLEMLGFEYESDVRKGVRISGKVKDGVRYVTFYGGEE